MGVRWRSVGRLCTVLVLWAVVVPSFAAPPLQEGQTVHVVRPGDTLYDIAQRYGVTVDAIVATNKLTNPNQIEVGQRLVIHEAAHGFRSLTAYVVQPGDTLTLIAHRFQVSVEVLATLNRLTNPSLIYVGQRLSIPVKGTEATAGGQVHVVQPGDTMARIAARYGTTVWQLAQANAITNPSVIYVGQRLFVPTGEGQSSLPLPFVAVHIIPTAIAQGQTGQVVVEVEGEATVVGSFGGSPLFFVGGAGSHRALIGIHAMSSLGPCPLDLKAVQGEQEVSFRSMVQVVAGGFGVQYLTVSGEKAQLLDPELVTQEAERIWNVTTQATLPGLWQGRFGLPLMGEPVITAPFGIRRSYNGGPVSSFHGGVDYSAAGGTPVYCPARGRVVLAEPLQVRGNAVVLDHGRGVMSCYWHLSQINVSVGDIVESGDLLGLVGSTGLSTGAHLHWEVRVMGVHVDPLQWVREHIQ